MKRLILVNLEKGGRGKHKDICRELKFLGGDIVVLTGFRNNQYSKEIIQEMSSLGFKYKILNNKIGRHIDTVAIFSKVEIKPNWIKGAGSSNFLIGNIGNYQIVSMDFSCNKNQKEIEKMLFDLYSNQAKEKQLIVLGSMMTAKNYATPNSDNMVCTKRFLNFNELGFINSWKHINPNKEEYTWTSSSGTSYNVDFILFSMKNTNKIHNCFYNYRLTKTKLSKHAIVILEIN